MFLFDLIDWWSGLSPWVRFGVALLILLASTVLWLTGSLAYLAWWGWAIGVAFLVFSFPSRAEKKGFHDF